MRKANQTAATITTRELSNQELDIVVGGIELVLNIASQSSGAGAGKVIFKEFSITRN